MSDVVRGNLLRDPEYAPYCLACDSMQRMRLVGRQFRCASCGTRTEFETEFMDRVLAFRQQAQETA